MWWGEERRRRAIRARVARGLKALGRTRGQERKRLRDAMADAVVVAQAAAADGGRRKTARLGGEVVAGTPAGGIHRVQGAYVPSADGGGGGAVEWERGGVKRSRAAERGRRSVGAAPTMREAGHVGRLTAHARQVF